MTFLVFLMGASLALNVAVIAIAAQAIVNSRRDRAALERTRLDVAAMLAELQRIKHLAEPMPIYASRKPVDLRVMIGNALVRYEREQSIKMLAADIEAIAA